MNKKQSLKEILYNYLLQRRKKWIHSGDLEKVAESYGKKGSTGSRRLRELNEDGMIHRELRLNKITRLKSVWYSVQM